MKTHRQIGASEVKDLASESYYFDCPFELKKLSADSGKFTGYAAIFGNVDLGGDVIMPGAFQEIVRNEDGKVVLLWQHDKNAPIGVADVSEDEHGLKFEGHLVLEDPLARKAYAHMKAGSVRAMSFGYDVLRDGAEYVQDGIRKLTKLKLWELSVVTFGMNPVARIAGVKATECKSLREFEALCGTQLGLSRRKARRVASAAWPLLADREDREDGGELGAGLSDQLAEIARIAGAPRKAVFDPKTGDPIGVVVIDSRKLETDTNLLYKAAGVEPPATAEQLAEKAFVTEVERLLVAESDSYIKKTNQTFKDKL